MTKLSKKGQLGQNVPPLPTILIRVISRPILQISAHMRCLYLGFDGQNNFKASYRLIDQVIPCCHYLMLRVFGCQTFSRSRRLVDMIPLSRLPGESLIGNRSSKSSMYAKNIMFDNTRLVLLFSICPFILVFISI